MNMSDCSLNPLHGQRRIAGSISRRYISAGRSDEMATALDPFFSRSRSSSSARKMSEGAHSPPCQEWYCMGAIFAILLEVTEMRRCGRWTATEETRMLYTPTPGDVSGVAPLRFQRWTETSRMPLGSHFASDHDRESCAVTMS
jgi:hypothetical protein